MNEPRNLNRLVEQINKSLLLGLDSPLQQWMRSSFSATQRLSDQMTFLVRRNFRISIPDIYVALPAIDTSTLVATTELARKIVESVRSVARWQESNTAVLRGLVEKQNIVARRIAADMSAFQLALENIVSSDIFREVLSRIQFNADAAEAFRAAGWPIAPSMSQDLIEHVVEMYREEKTRYISRAIMGYYQRNDSENLHSTVDSWSGNPLFDSRMHIINDALDAHCSGRFTLSVPALLPLVEGVLNDYVIINSLPARFGRIGQVYNAVIGDPDDYSLSVWAIANTLLFQLNSSTYAFTDFGAELSKSINNRKTTRHTVLHGITSNYDRPIHSLRLFVLLDALSALQELEADEVGNDT